LQGAQFWRTLKQHACSCSERAFRQWVPAPQPLLCCCPDAQSCASMCSRQRSTRCHLCSLLATAGEPFFFLIDMFQWVDSFFVCIRTSEREAHDTFSKASTFKYHEARGVISSDFHRVLLCEKLEIKSHLFVLSACYGA
jgi:hypothetical protein